MHMNSERTQAYGRVVKTLDEIGPTKLQPAEQARVREAADTLIFAADLDDARAAMADVDSLAEHLDVLEGGAGLLGLGGEDQRVGGVADAVLLGGLELGGTEVVEGLDDPPVGLCAFRRHDAHLLQVRTLVEAHPFL